MKKYVVNSKEELREIILSASPDADLNYLDVSGLTDMSFVFDESSFNGNISEWDVSNVIDMKCMFYNSAFTRDISKWNVSSVRRMREMFSRSSFNSDISNWDVSSVRDMLFMFSKSVFDRDIHKWNISDDCDIGENGSNFLYKSGIMENMNYHYIPESVIERFPFQSYKSRYYRYWDRVKLLGEDLSELF